MRWLEMLLLETTGLFFPARLMLSLHLMSQKSAPGLKFLIMLVRVLKQYVNLACLEPYHKPNCLLRSASYHCKLNNLVGVGFRSELRYFKH